MSTPTADDFKALIPDPSASICSNLVNTLLKLPVKLWQYVKGREGTEVRTADYIFSGSPSAQDATRLLCDGAEYPKTDYPALYTAIGDIYGTPISGSNFKVPNFSGKFPVGVGAFTNQGSTVLGVARGVDQFNVVNGNLPKIPKPLTIATTNGTDHVVNYTASASSAGNKNGPGIGAGDIGNRPQLEINIDYGQDFPLPIPMVPPCLPVYVYIKT